MEGYIFDYRLGYVRGGCDLQGFDVMESPGGPGARLVAALGGYTGAAEAREGRSWAHELHRMADGRFRTLSGCTDGYSSAQILTMFARDVILFNPDTVICLSGFYNIAYKLGFLRDAADKELLKSHPFATPVQIGFLKKITSRFGIGNGAVYYGEENGMPAWELWLRQMAEINCLCGEFGIKFMSFLQPCAFSGSYKINDRESLFLRERYALTESGLDGFRDGFREEYARIAGGAAGLGYVTDLSGVFDGCEDAYEDACHVKRGFIPKIAEKILEKIL